MRALILLCIWLGCTSCSPEPEVTTVFLEFPSLPESWSELLGEPDWSLVWCDSEGSLQREDVAGFGPGIGLSLERFSPVLAWPSWSSRGLHVGDVPPAGAIAPWGLSGTTLRLTWLSGVSAAFYLELAHASGPGRTAPEHFNWPRFEELIGTLCKGEGALPDPWLVDWREVALKTRSLGFDSRRLVASSGESCTAVLPAEGPWYPLSPFARPFDGRKGDAVALPASGGNFPAFCRQGVLRWTSSCSAWFPFP